MFIFSINSSLGKFFKMFTFSYLFHIYFKEWENDKQRLSNEMDKLQSQREEDQTRLQEFDVSTVY